MAASLPTPMVLWIVGAAVALVGLGIGAWALLADRLRGRERRRCPKCWYDMAALPGLTCPECGTTARNERQLSRSRRRWLWAAGGLLLMFGGFGGPPAMLVWQRGWAALPTWALIEALRIDASESLRRTIDARLRPPGPGARAYSGPPRDDPPRWDADKLSSLGWRRVTGACLGLLGSSDQRAATWAVMVLAWKTPDPLVTFPELARKLGGSNLLARIDAANVVMLTGGRFAADLHMTPGGVACREAAPQLLGGLVALLEIAPSDPLLSTYPTRDTLPRTGLSGVPVGLGRATDARSVARSAAAAALGSLAIADPSVIDALQAAAVDGDPATVYFAKGALRAIEMSQELADEMR